MIDQTRDMALMMQKGIRDCKTWNFGPLTVGVLEFPGSKAYMLCLAGFGAGLNLSLWSGGNSFPPGKVAK